MKIKPLGFYVLIEMEVVEETSAGGIILDRDLVNKEQDATDTGYVRAIGPTAYAGYPGCDLFAGGGDVTAVDVLNGVTSPTQHGCWGLEIGDKIEYRKFEGKKSSAEGYENYRYIPDSHIIGVISDE